MSDPVMSDGDKQLFTMFAVAFLVLQIAKYFFRPRAKPSASDAKTKQSAQVDHDE